MRYRIAALSSGFIYSYHRQLFSGIARAAEECGVDLVGIPCGPAGIRNDELAKRNILYDLIDPSLYDGFIVPYSSLGQYCGYAELEKKLAAVLAKPSVAIGGVLRGHPSIIPDDSTGIRELFVHLIRQHGCRRFLFIRGEPRHITSSAREAAARAALTDCCLPPDSMVVSAGQMNVLVARETIDRYWRAGTLEGFDAIVAVSDGIAIASMKRLQELGMSVPGDIIVCGSSGYDEALYCSPTLSSVDVEVERNGYEALRILVDLLGGEKVPDVTMHASSPRFRQSCGCVALDEGLILEPAQIVEVGKMFAAQARAGAKEEGSDLQTIVHDAFPGPDERFFFQGLEAALKACSGRFTQNRGADTHAYLNLFRQLGFSLINRADFRELFDLMHLYLGTDYVFISSFERGGVPFAESRLLSAFRQARALTISEEGILFRTASFVPAELLPEERSTLVIEPLYYENEHLGLIVMDFDARYGLVYEAIAAQISAALQNRVQREKIERAEQRYYDMALVSSDWLWEIDSRGTIVYSSEGAERLLGFSAGEIEGKNFFDLFFPADRGMRARFKTRLLQDRELLHGMEVLATGKGGEGLFLLLSGKPLFGRDRAFMGFRGAGKDITLTKRAEERIKYLAFYDPLTGLPNRRLLMDRMETLIRSSKRSNAIFALLFIDLDNFKIVNDRQGHDAGDAVLKGMAELFAACIREDDTLARVGGDEFVLILPKVASEEAVGAIAARIAGKIAQCSLAASSAWPVTCSIGISLFPRDGTTAPVILKSADIAMYVAKKEGKNRFSLYRPEMREAERSHQSLETRLKSAIEREELRLLYQPEIELPGGMIIGFEALLSWNPRDSEPIRSSDLMVLAEEADMIAPIEEWALEAAATAAKKWRRAYGLELRMGIELSSRRLREPELVARFCTLLGSLGLTPGAMEFEISAQAASGNASAAIQALGLFRREGIHIVLEGFGAGISSLGYLRSLPLDGIKIDKSLIRQIEEDSGYTAILRSIADMAEALNLTAVADGVETQAQARALIDSGFHAAQGSFFRSPMVSDEAEAYLRSIVEGTADAST